MREAYTITPDLDLASEAWKNREMANELGVMR